MAPRRSAIMAHHPLPGNTIVTDADQPRTYDKSVEQLVEEFRVHQDETAAIQVKMAKLAEQLAERAAKQEEGKKSQRW
jgi:hypothetical protein